jgi:hypothetical protein
MFAFSPVRGISKPVLVLRTTGYNFSPVTWMDPVSVIRFGADGSTGATAWSIVGETESLQAAARNRPALNNQGSNRERSMGCFSCEGIMIECFGFTSRHDITGDPWPDCRRGRSLTVLLS